MTIKYHTLQQITMYDSTLFGIICEITAKIQAIYKIEHLPKVASSLAILS